MFHVERRRTLECRPEVLIHYEHLNNHRFFTIFLSELAHFSKYTKVYIRCSGSGTTAWVAASYHRHPIVAGGERG
jgi:hypothetical protein